MSTLRLPVSRASSICVFLYLSLLLTTARGYSIGLGLLLLLSLWALTQVKTIQLKRSDYVLLFALLAAGSIQVVVLTYNGASWSELDLPLRYIAVIPILLLCLHYPPTFSGLFGGVWVGAVLTAILAASELSTPYARATGFTGGIQFGNLGLLLGVFALGIALFGLEAKKHTSFVVLAFVAGVAGVFVSIASGSRGGWVALPVVVLVFYGAYVKRQNALRLGVFVILGALLLLGAASQIPSIKTRVDQVQTNLIEYKKGNVNTSIGVRLSLWQAELQLIAQRPLTGWNKAQHAVALENMVKQHKVDETSSKLANSHNTFLELWIYTGLFGLLGVLFLFGVAGYGFLIKIRSSNPYTKFAAVSGLNLVLSYMIFSQTQIMLGRNNTLVFFLLMLCLFWGMMRHTDYMDSKRLQPVD